MRDCVSCSSWTRFLGRAFTCLACEQELRKEEALRAELAAARAEVERLRGHELERSEAALQTELASWRRLAEYGCENPPEGCGCAGCSQAREHAEQGNL